MPLNALFLVYLSVLQLVFCRTAALKISSYIINSADLIIIYIFSSGTLRPARIFSELKIECLKPSSKQDFNFLTPFRNVSLI